MKEILLGFVAICMFSVAGVLLTQQSELHPSSGEEFALSTSTPTQLEESPMEEPTHSVIPPQKEVMEMGEVLVLPTPTIQAHLPTPTPSTQVAPSPTPTPLTISEAEIVPEAAVHMLCHFKSNNPTESFSAVTQGSGVIVSPEGHILTARHVIDGKYTAEFYNHTEEQQRIYSMVELEYCEVGIPSIPQTNPNEEILANMKAPYQYIAHKVPTVETFDGISDIEKGFLDFALLKIDGMNPEYSKSYRNLQIPKQFPYNKILPFTPPVGADVLSYSYPTYYQSSYEDLITLKRHTAVVDDIDTGDTYFNQQPVRYRLKVEGAFGSATSRGSSGSPIFWKGYVAGVFYAANNKLERFYVASTEAINTILKQKGYSFGVK